MILLLTLTLLLQLSYACPQNCNSCTNPNYCNNCSSGYYLYAQSCYQTITIKYSTSSIEQAIQLMVFIIWAGVIIYMSLLCCPFIGGAFCFVLAPMLTPLLLILGCYKYPDQPTNNKARDTNIILRRDISQNNLQWKNFKAFQQQQTCTVCMDKSVYVKTDCGHGFHAPCIQIWFNKRATCPTCRAKINNIRLFCTICLLKYRTLSLQQNRNMEKEVTICNICIQ